MISVSDFIRFYLISVIYIYSILFKLGILFFRVLFYQIWNVKWKKNIHNLKAISLSSSSPYSCIIAAKRTPNVFCMPNTVPFTKNDVKHITQPLRLESYFSWSDFFQQMFPDYLHIELSYYLYIRSPDYLNIHCHLNMQQRFPLWVPYLSNILHKLSKFEMYDRNNSAQKDLYIKCEMFYESLV